MEIAKEKLQEWSELTEWNCHGEALLSIAEYYNLERYVKIFTEINKLHEKAGNLPYGLNLIRYEVSKMMFTDIERIWGDEVRYQIVKCL